jgi:RNA polymerase sigma factor (TIGR02999 family)
MQTGMSALGGPIRAGKAGGDPTTTDTLITEVYEQLRRLAGAYLKRDASEPMLEPAVLVNEAYLRLAGQPPDKWKNKEHFLAVAAMAMRKVLIDCARRRHTLKRGYGRSRVSLELVTRTGPREVDILEVDNALRGLAAINERASCAVVLRFFAGLTHEQIASVQAVSRKTVVSDWSQARNWLADALAERPAPKPPA